MDLKTFVNSDWNHGHTLLNLAVKTSNINLVNTVLKYDVNIHQQDNYGYTALFDCKDNDILKVLLDAGIDPNIQCNRSSETVLFRQQNVETVKILLDANIDPNITNRCNENALYYYCRFLMGSIDEDKLKIIYELLPVTNLDNNNGESLSVLIQRRRTEFDLLKRIISGMKNLNHVDINGNSFLHYAARNQSYWDVIKLLIDSGVDLNIENNDGEDFYDLCYKNVQKLIKANYPKFIDDKETRNTASKYGM